MRQKCKNCRHFGKTVTHVWYDRLTGERHEDHYNNCCCMKYQTIEKSKINQFNKCPYYVEENYENKD